MFLSDRQMELQNILNDLKKQVELLDSHKMVGLINDKQYKESMFHIAVTLDKLEQEIGIPQHRYSALDIMYKESMEKLEQEIKERYSKSNNNLEDDEPIFNCTEENL